MGSKVTVRPQRSSDGPAIAEIFESTAVVAETSQLPYLPADFWSTLYERRSDQAAVLIAEIDGRVAGHLGLIPDARPRRRHVGSFGLAVHEDFHGQGAGAALMEAMLELADNWFGLLRVELTVYAHNKHAIRLYERFGFREEGRSPCDTMVAGKLADSVSMARLHPDALRFEGLT